MKYIVVTFATGILFGLKLHVDLFT